MNTDKTNRRRFIKTLSAGATVAIAGCSGQSSDGSSGSQSTEAPTDTASESDSEETAASTTTQTGQETYSAVMSMSTLQLPFFNRMRNRFVAMADQQESLESLGAFDAQGNQSTQINDLETALGNDPDFLIINPVTSAGIRPIVQQANDEDIPIVTIDRSYVNQEEVASFVGSNNFDLGLRSTNMLIRLMEQKYGERDEYNVVQLQGIPGTSAATNRTQGFETAVSESGRLNVLESLVGDFSVQGAIAPMEDLISSYGDDIDGVFAQNDPMARGAVQVLSNNDMADTPITGVDGGQAWVEMIRDNQYYGTMAQQPVVMVNRSVEHGKAAVDGEDVPTVDHVDGIEVTNENAAEFLENNYQYTD